MISVIIPTYNAESYLHALLNAIKSQSIDCEIIVIDSESTDGTQNILDSLGVKFYSIPKGSFNHGSTRNYGVSLASYENIIFLTQDALPVNADCFRVIIDALNSDKLISVAYGRQLPHNDADIYSIFARSTNYPSTSIIKSVDNIEKLGIRACHLSNSFAAYKKKDMIEVGGFPTDTILGEDVTIAAKLILHNKKIFYCASAEVYHSHNYSLSQEFKRYFDIGVFHQQQKQVLSKFKGTSTEGFHYFFNEIIFLNSIGKTSQFFYLLLRTIVKFTGYKTGSIHRILPTSIKRSLSMHKHFWDRSIELL